MLTTRQRTKEIFLDAFNGITQKCIEHSLECKDCYMPIMDEEGNPQYLSEACSVGASLLRDYRLIEDTYFGLWA